MQSPSENTEYTSARYAVLAEWQQQWADTNAEGADCQQVKWARVRRGRRGNGYGSNPSHLARWARRRVSLVAQAKCAVAE
jgi:hypothetical protein